MREFELEYKGLGAGLRRRSRTVRSEYGLTECYNLVPQELGLEPYDPISMPFTSKAVNWPFPQVLTLSKYHLLLEPSGAYTIDDDFNLTAVLNGSENSKGLWHVADFGTYVLLTDGATFIYFDTTYELWKRQVNPSSTLPLVNTVCAFNGQCVAGGINSDWYDCDGNSVIWSKIGSLDFLLDQMNLSGYHHMPIKGEVLCVKPLGKGVVVYGSTYIMLMFPAEQSFGFHKLGSYGLCGRDAVAGDLRHHVFVDLSGRLRMIDSEFNVKDLGYQEFFYPLLGEDIIASFNPVTGEFNFCTEDMNYILTDKGALASHLQCITSIGITDQGVICMAENLSDTSGYFTTDSIDFHQRGQKTIQAATFALESDQSCQAAIDWRNNHKNSYQRSPLKPVNQEGVAHLPVAGSDLRVHFYTPDYTNTFVDTMTVKYKVTDKRYLRGIYADQAIA